MTSLAHADPQRQSYKITFAVLAIGGIAYALLQSLVAPALPDLQRQLHTTENGAGWILTAYLLSASVATPILGRLGDMYGKERVLFLVLVLLAAGTLLSAVAGSLSVMLAGRVLQGAAGGIFPLAFGIIRDEFPREKVAGGIGLMSSLIGIGGGAGVVLAGVIVEHLSYHYLFWIPLPVIVAVAVATYFFVPESPVKAPAAVNWMAGALMSLGLVVLLVGVSQATSWGWGSPKTLGMIVAGLLILALWVRIEIRSREPLVDMKMMRIKGVWTTNTVALLLGAGMYSSFVLIPTFVQEPKSTGYGFGASIIGAGLFLLPSTIAMVVVGQAAGAINRRVGSRPPLIVGAGFSAVAFVLLSVARSEEWQIYLASLLLGIGIGLAFAALANLIVQNVPQEQTGVATGMNTVMRTLGGAVGAQVAATFLANDIVNGSPSSDAFTMAFGLCAVALVAGLLVSFLVPTRAAVGEVDPHRPPLPGEPVGQQA